MRKLAHSVAAASLFLSGAVPAISAVTTLNIQYAWPSQKSFHEPLAEAFMKEHPDIKINYLSPAASYTDGQQRILRGAVTGNLPDIWYSGYNYLPELVQTLKARHAIMPLTDLIEKEGPSWSSDNYSAAMIALGQIDGAQWAMPFTASTAIVYYNKEMLASVGADGSALKTWDGVIQVAAKIYKEGKADGLGYPVSEAEDDWLWQALVMSYGGHIMNPARMQVAFGDQKGAEAVAILPRLVEEAHMPALNEDQVVQQFVAGKLGIYIGSSSEVRSMDQNIGGKFHFATAPYPQVAENHGGLPVGGSAAVILASDSAKRKAAWEFIKFVTGPEGQKIIALKSGYMPTNIKTTGPQYLADFYNKNPNWMTSISQWPLAQAWVGYPAGSGPRIWAEQKNILSGIIRGEIAPDSGLKQLVNITQKLALPAK
ncbi:ABC transporter substrate-binding protein [Kosakonia sp. MUSA4]|uniref:ABC transporter substrate-binding protein n=1 Tax=Kosakonia sp. MUSA4 TaxID=2067958 RepID=UPI001599DF6D|nr:ABC transporter substrate-binding protein [Kosakonia sp. MUSA4]QJT80548.1 ABC transporter substrate-binding protein [Kosakonia sp. MUSA4]